MALVFIKRSTNLGASHVSWLPAPRHASLASPSSLSPLVSSSRFGKSQRGAVILLILLFLLVFLLVFLLFLLIALFLVAVLGPRPFPKIGPSTSVAICWPRASMYAQVMPFCRITGWFLGEPAPCGKGLEAQLTARSKG